MIADSMVVTMKAISMMMAWEAVSIPTINAISMIMAWEAVSMMATKAVSIATTTDASSGGYTPHDLCHGRKLEELWSGMSNTEDTMGNDTVPISKDANLGGKSTNSKDTESNIKSADTGSTDTDDTNSKSAKSDKQQQEWRALP